MLEDHSLAKTCSTEIFPGLLFETNRKVWVSRISVISESERNVREVSALGLVIENQISEKS